MEHNDLKNTYKIPEQDMVNWMLTVAERALEGYDPWTMGIAIARKTEEPSSSMLVSGSTGPSRRLFWLLGDNTRKKLSSRAFSSLRNRGDASGHFWFHVKPPTGEFEYFASWGPLCGKGNKGYISIQDGKQTCRLTEFIIS